MSENKMESLPSFFVEKDRKSDIAPFVPALVAAEIVPYAFTVVGPNGEFIAVDYIRATKYANMEDLEDIALGFAHRDYGNDVKVLTIHRVSEIDVLQIIENLPR